MTPEETAGVLRMFRSSWSYFKIDDDVTAMWSTTCAAVDGVVGARAALKIVEEDDNAPAVSRFLRVVDALARGVEIEPSANPTADCEYCDHGFIAGAPVEQRYAMPDGSVKVSEASTAKPCEHCRPAQYAAWRERTGKVNARRSRTADEDRTYPANPREGLAMVRDVLAKTKPWQPSRDTTGEGSPPGPAESPARVTEPVAWDPRDRMLGYDEVYPGEAEEEI